MYKKLLLLCISSFFCTMSSLYARMGETNNNGDAVNPTCGCPYTMEEQQFAAEEELTLHVDKTASFKGGDGALKEYEERLIQNPANSLSDSTKYSILCRFIVERDGSASHIELLNRSDGVFETEAKRFIETMPKWVPAQKDGKPVRSWHSLRLFFGYPKAN